LIAQGQLRIQKGLLEMAQTLLRRKLRAFDSNGLFFLALTKI
jgi:hypothetical protein